MVSPHTGIPDSSEWYVWIGNMGNNIIDAYSAGRGLPKNFILFDTVFGKIIKSQGLLMRIDICDHFADINEFDDRQYRTEDLFLHYSIPGLYVVKNSRRNITVFNIDLSSGNDCSTTQESSKPLSFVLAYNPGEIITFLWN